MLFNNLMHVSFYTDRLEAMEDFYINKLGGELKIVTRAKAYLDRPQSGYHALALADPEKVIIVYIELAPGQFVELFPKNAEQGPASRMGENLGYAHFALTVDHAVHEQELSGGRPHHVAQVVPWRGRSPKARVPQAPSSYIKRGAPRGASCRVVACAERAARSSVFRACERWKPGACRSGPW